ncbi:MAG: chemotaxis protein CheW [Nitrospirae bacterium]|nr:chemotaxis protein CheW [Nitrospirota bacterium]
MNMTKEKEETGSHTDDVTYNVFKVGEKEFLLPVDTVREIIEISRIFPIPMAPDYIFGAVPLHGGRVIPAIDLSKIHPTGEPLYSSAKLVVVSAGKENIGFLSETIPYLVSFSPDIPVDGLINVDEFFETYRVKGPWHGRT